MKKEYREIAADDGVMGQKPKDDETFELEPNYHGVGEAQIFLVL